MQIEPSPCFYDPFDLPETIERYRALVKDGRCPHIDVFEVETEKLSVGVVMDSNCHIEYERKVDPCKKGEGNLLRVLAVKYFDARNHELIKIVPFLRSGNAPLLRFEGGADIGSEHVLHLKDRALWIGPAFQKGPGSNRRTIRTLRCSELDFTRVPVTVSVSIERESPYGRVAGVLHLNVAVQGEARENDRGAGQEREVSESSSNGDDSASEVARRARMLSNDRSVAVVAPVAVVLPGGGWVGNGSAASSDSMVGGPPLEEEMRHLGESARKDVERLRELDDLLRYETDNLQRAKYEEMLRRVEASFSKHKRQFQDLQKCATAGLVAVGWQVSSEFERLEERLESLVAAQRELAGEFRVDLAEGLERTAERISAEISASLDATAQGTVKAVLAGIELRASDDHGIQELLSSVEELIQAVKRIEAAVPTDLQSRVSVAEAVIEATHLDVKHRLRVTIPIIPLVVSYMSELELKGGLSVSALWENIVKRFRSDQA